MRYSRRFTVNNNIIKQLIERNSLRLLDHAEAVYGGSCPMCGEEKSFILWADKAKYRCFWCGCDGKYAPTPERVAEARRILQESKDLG